MGDGATLHGRVKSFPRVTGDAARGVVRVTIRSPRRSRQQYAPVI
jgi:hypothetical protein